MCLLCDDPPNPNTCAYASTCNVCGKKFFGYGYNATDYPCGECSELLKVFDDVPGFETVPKKARVQAVQKAIKLSEAKAALSEGSA